MLRKMAQSNAKLTGKHQALDAFMDARQALLVQYIHLSTNKKALPEPKELSDFCSELVDYVSAAHFEIYDYVMAAYEAARGNGRTLAERIYVRLKKVRYWHSIFMINMLKLTVTSYYWNWIKISTPWAKC